jgi:hypothetical protein
MVLTIRGRTPGNVFHLNGVDENSATYALGWVLEKSLHFRSNMLATWFGKDISLNDPIISLQRLEVTVVTPTLKSTGRRVRSAFH